MNPMSTGNAVFFFGGAEAENRLCLRFLTKVLFGGAPFYSILSILSILSINCAAPTVLAGNLGYQKLAPCLPSVKTLPGKGTCNSVRQYITVFCIFCQDIVFTELMTFYKIRLIFFIFNMLR